MVAHFVRLKLTLLANGFRRSTWQTIGAALALMYAFSLVVLMVGGLVVLGSFDSEALGIAVTIGGSLATVTWWVGPLFFFGIDATLDPQKFAHLPLSRRTLMAGLGAASFTTIPSMAMAVVVLGVAVAYWRDPAAALVALVGGALGLCSCVLGSRAIATAAASVLGTRRFREMAIFVGALSLVAFVVVVQSGQWIASWITQHDSLQDQTMSVVTVLQWTPLGAPWGLADAVVSGDTGVLLLRVLVVLVTLAGWWWLWDRALAKALVLSSPRRAASVRRGLGILGRVPASPQWAIAARCAMYWFRDQRYLISIVMLPVLPVVLWITSRTIVDENGNPFSATSYVVLFAGPMMAWASGFSISADIAYDNSAFAWHLVSSVRGRDDRWGRVIPVLAAGGVVVTAVAVWSIVVVSEWRLLPAVIGVTWGTLLTSLGVSSALSARLIYPVAKPGQSPFTQPQGAAMATMTAQSIAMAAQLLVVSPIVLIAGLSWWGPTAAWAPWVALVAGFGLGVAVLNFGIRFGARWLDRDGPKVLQQVMSFT